MAQDRPGWWNGLMDGLIEPDDWEPHEVYNFGGVLSVMCAPDLLFNCEKHRPNLLVSLADLRKVLGTFAPGIDEEVNQAARALAVKARMGSWPGHNGWGLS